MIHREEARLRSLFRRLLLLSAAASPAACSSSEAGAVARDASLAPDATQSAPATDSGQSGPATDAGTSDDAAPPSDAPAPIVDAGGGALVDALDLYGFLDAACDPQYLPNYLDGGDASCDFFEYLPCGLPPATPTEVCALLVSQCGVLCSHDPTANRLCAVAECLAVDASTRSPTEAL